MGRHQELTYCDCGGGVARGLIAVHRVSLGYLWWSSDWLRSYLQQNGDCHEVIFGCLVGGLILLFIPAVIGHGFDGIGFWCWGILYLNRIK